ncbi:response regulator transcription factor [Phaeodactylibacter sp.]|uniref:response regulator transcription factor n=1 Tax=Phaeodactylibacter sp. TaxID=1940289 RepID=UPI0025F3A862|nr:response regulator transcription factor [Phaeodactylibacter sp.]MCI4650710.1 response regulator transcription factor [Phaeodactylibacter sp.]MCI5093052.1 response regulator transcription factor [Phaeodactylibacter sp.]
MSQVIRTAIIDDQDLLLQQMKMLLELSAHHIRCTLMATSVESFFDQLLEQQLTLDIILLDLDLRGQESITHLPKIKRLAKNTKVIMVTGHDNPVLLAKAIESGADGYFVKRTDPQPDLAEVVKLTYEGGAFLEPSISANLLKAFQNRKLPHHQVNIGELSKNLNIILAKREIEVLDGLLEEKSYQEIADDNHISINTVRHYVKGLYQKVGVSSRRELIEKVVNS